jgi:DNA-directed RNA polymerase specialized sigma24 family protein
MVHQQYALIPQWVASIDQETLPTYCCGDLVADVIERYQQQFQSDFFTDYLKAIARNTRTDQGEGEQSLAVWEDEHVLLFVPKAQVSQWELQLMVTAEDERGPVGNVIEADTGVRRSLDLGILKAQQVLAGLGATMGTSIEYSKRLGLNNANACSIVSCPNALVHGRLQRGAGPVHRGDYPKILPLPVEDNCRIPEKPENDVSSFANCCFSMHNAKFDF